MAPTHESSDSGNLDLPKRSHKVFTLSEKMRMVQWALLREVSPPLGILMVSSPLLLFFKSLEESSWAVHASFFHWRLLGAETRLAELSIESPQKLSKYLAHKYLLKRYMNKCIWMSISRIITNFQRNCSFRIIPLRTKPFHFSYTLWKSFKISHRLWYHSLLEWRIWENWSPEITLSSYFSEMGR